MQVQGQAEQPRVLMVSVPYAFKAHEAETLGGKSASDFALANGATSTASSGSNARQHPPARMSRITRRLGARFRKALPVRYGVISQTVPQPSPPHPSRVPP